MQIKIRNEFAFRQIIQTARDLAQVQKDEGIDNSVNMTEQDKRDYIDELNSLCSQLDLFCIQ